MPKIARGAKHLEMPFICALYVSYVDCISFYVITARDIERAI